MASTPEVSAWRIDRRKWQKTSFSGSGAQLEGGRWNSAGVAVVYASRNLSMAALEKFVHFSSPLPARQQFVAFALRFHEVEVEVFPVRRLAKGWNQKPPIAVSQSIGDEWFHARRTAILQLPSAIIPEEANFLLNPLHPDFPRIRIAPAQPFTFDSRLLAWGQPR
jgi:RES domain-containing protein